MSHSLSPPHPGGLSSPETLPRWVDPQLYPFTPRAFTTASGTMRYLDQGKGRPVVIVHGTPSWSFEWRAVVSALQASHRVIVPDHLGFGLSDKPRDVSRLTPQAHAERLALLIEALDLRDAILVVHDFGGPIGFGAALASVDRFAGIVASNTWMGSLSHRKDVRRLSALVRSPLGRLLYLGLNASPRWIVPAAFGRREALGREAHRHYMAPFPTWASRVGPWKLGVELAGSAAFYESIWARRSPLRRLPARIVWGAADPTFGLADLAHLGDALSTQDVTSLDGVGHFTAEEAPESIVSAVRSLG